MTWPVASKCWAASRFPLSRATTFRIGGPAELAARPRNAEDVADMLRWARGEGRPVRCLGMGSNLLVADEGVKGLVLLTRAMDSIAIDGLRVAVGAGVTNARILNATRAKGLGGLQCLVGFPGTMGGAVRMNAGGTPGTIGPRVEWVRGVDGEGKVVTRSQEECGFRYRGSDLADLVVTEVGLILEPVDAEEYALECHAIVRRKRDTQPMELPSAGCVWKNPPGASAGSLVDLAGCKGLRAGDAEVSTRHANFIVNRGAAKCADVLGLMSAVRRRVLDRFGVDLPQEVIHWSDGAG